MSDQNNHFSKSAEELLDEAQSKGLPKPGFGTLYSIFIILLIVLVNVYIS